MPPMARSALPSLPHQPGVCHLLNISSRVGSSRTTPAPFSLFVLAQLIDQTYSLTHTYTLSRAL